MSEEWTTNALHHLSTLMQDERCKALLTTDFYDNASTEWTERKLNFNQIKTALSNDQYPSKESFLLDVDSLFQNAITISDNQATSTSLDRVLIKSGLIEMHSVFKEYRASDVSKSNEQTMEIEEKEDDQTSNKMEVDPDPERGDGTEESSAQSTTETETDQENPDHSNSNNGKVVTIKSKSKRKTRNIAINKITSASVTTNTQRRRSARIAKKNKRVESDENDLNIYIGINVGKGSGRKRRTPKLQRVEQQSKGRKRKRGDSSATNKGDGIGNGGNGGNGEEATDSFPSRRTRSKVARLSATHSSPNEEGEVAIEDIEVVPTPKKRRRSRRNSRKRHSESSEGTECADNPDAVCTDNKLKKIIEIDDEMPSLEDPDDHSNNAKGENTKQTMKSKNINIIVLDEDEDEDEEDDDVDMKSPSKEMENNESSTVSTVNRKYNLRSKSSKSLFNGKKPTLKSTKTLSKSVSRTLSISPQNKGDEEGEEEDDDITGNLMNGLNLEKNKNSNSNSNSNPNRKSQESRSETLTTLENENIRESSLESIKSMTESVMDFEDGMQDSLCGKFELSTNMRYSCKALCVNGDFKPFNQDWVSLDRFDQFRDQRPVIVCGVYDGHGILGHNSSKYVARHLPKEFMFHLHDLKTQQRPKYRSESPRALSAEANDHQIHRGTESSNDDELESNAMEHALRSGLRRVDEELREISRNETTMFSTILTRNGCNARLIDYGTTVNCLVSDGENIVVLNVGDSRCILIEGFHDESNGNKWKWTHRAVTSDHNPVLRKDEVDRVCRENGNVHVQGQEMRIFPKGLAFKEARRKGLAINMSRAVGHSTLCDHGLVAEPEVYRIAIEEDHEYIFVMASDGVWDVMGNEEVFGVVQQLCGLSMHDQTETTIEEEIAVEVLEAAEKKWKKRRVGDNVSVVVTRIVKRR